MVAQLVRIDGADAVFVTTRLHFAQTIAYNADGDAKKDVAHHMRPDYCNPFDSTVLSTKERTCLPSAVTAILPVRVTLPSFLFDSRTVTTSGTNAKEQKVNTTAVYRQAVTVS